MAKRKIISSSDTGRLSRSEVRKAALELRKSATKAGKFKAKAEPIRIETTSSGRGDIGFQVESEPAQKQKTRARKSSKKAG